MTATFRSTDKLDATWQAVQSQAAEAQATGADVNRLIERDAEAHNARVLAIREARESTILIGASTVRSARHEKPAAVQRLYAMARMVALLISAPDYQRVADWIDAHADLTEPRTARELAAQWRERENDPTH